MTPPSDEEDGDHEEEMGLVDRIRGDRRDRDDPFQRPPVWKRLADSVLAFVSHAGLLVGTAYLLGFGARKGWEDGGPS